MAIYVERDTCACVVTGHLGPHDLCAVLNAIYTVRHKWYCIGLELKIPDHTLDAIKAQCPNNIENCLKEMLKRWLTSISPPPTWSDLVQALLSAPVEEKRLAKKIREQYCHQDGEQATGPAPGEL